MARSADALQRRALKRDRTVEEQQRIENHLSSKKRKPLNQIKLETNIHSKKKKKIQIDESVEVVGPCSNKETLVDGQSAVLEDVSNTKQQQQQQQQPQQQQHKDIVKSIWWSKPQAPQDQVEANQRLRQRFREQDPSLTDQERERARILLARDERAKIKKKQHKKPKELNISNQGTSSVPTDPEDSATEPVSSKEQHKINKSLLKKYKKTKGLGMTEAEVTRVNQLLERKLRKLQRPNKRTENLEDSGQAMTHRDHDLPLNTATTKNDGNEKQQSHKKARQKKKAKKEAGNLETDGDDNNDNRDQVIDEPSMTTQQQEEKRKAKVARKQAKKDAKKSKKESLAAVTMEGIGSNKDQAPEAADATKTEKKRKKEKKARRKSEEGIEKSN